MKFLLTLWWTREIILFYFIFIEYEKLAHMTFECDL